MTLQLHVLRNVASYPGLTLIVKKLQPYTKALFKCQSLYKRPRDWVSFNYAARSAALLTALCLRPGSILTGYEITVQEYCAELWGNWLSISWRQEG
jgi:hypothetical protein